MDDRISFCRDNKMYDRIRYCRVAVTTFGHEGHEFSSSRGGAFANTNRLTATSGFRRWVMKSWRHELFKKKDQAGGVGLLNSVNSC
jgi:hypothetical protein